MMLHRRMTRTALSVILLTTSCWPLRAETTGTDARSACDRLAASPYDRNKPSDVPGVPYDRFQASGAVEVCREALRLNKDDLRMMFNLGRSLYKQNKASSESVRLLRESAEAGYPAAMAGYAFTLYEDASVAKDLNAIFVWYSRAADAGDAGGLYNAGEMLIFGTGVNKDPIKGLSFVRKAADQKLPIAMYRLALFIQDGTLIKNDPLEVVRLFTQAAELGDSAAMYELGALYWRGGDGVPRDYMTGFSWMMRGAEAGNVVAMRRVGQVLRDRNYSADDNKYALTWLRKAAEAGDTEATLSLGILAESGSSDEKDLTLAESLYRKAAEDGSTEAMRRLAILLTQDPVSNAKDVEAFRWLKVASAKGDDPFAMGMLGLMLEKGRGAPRDHAQAVTLFSAAAKKGNTGATQILNQFGASNTDKQGVGSSLTSEQALGILALGALGLALLSGSSATGSTEEKQKDKQWNNNWSDEISKDSDRISKSFYCGLTGGAGGIGGSCP